MYRYGIPFPLSRSRRSLMTIRCQWTALLSAIRYPIGSPIIVMIWKVVFANKSRKLGCIWMKWGWGLKRLPCTFPAKSRYVFRWLREKMGRIGVVFLWCERRTTSATFLGSISAKLPTNTCPGGGSRHMASYSWKVSIKGSSLPKTLFLGYPICAQPTGHGKCSATPTLFPSPSGHPTDLSFLRDFWWGVYRFPPIRLRKSPYQQWAYLDGDTIAPPGEKRDITQ